jgi:hypothetical protein
VTTALVLLAVLAAPFVVPAIATVVLSRRVRARREALAARARVGKLLDPRDRELL